MNKTTLVFIISTLVHCSQGMGGLLVAPTRVQLSDKQRVTTVSLKHLGNKIGKYRLSLIFNRMFENGSFEEIRDPKPEERSAIKMIKFSPRLVVLEPNIEQVVRVMVVSPKNIPDGDYRAHLLFEPTEDTETEKLAGIKESDNKPQIGMHLEAKVSVAVPVVFSHGKTYSSITLKNPTLVKTTSGNLAVSVDILNIGNSFPRGDLKASLLTRNKTLSLGMMRSLPLYAPKVRFSIPVSKEVKFASLPNGVLKVEYLKPEEIESSPKRELASVKILLKALHSQTDSNSPSNP